MDSRTAGPRPAVITEVAPGIRRVLAPNPSHMTQHGTNTYLLGSGQGLAVVDPGPDSAAHLDALMEALRPGQRITHIFVTHAHIDHSPLARRLSEASGAPVLAFGGPRAGQSEVMAKLAADGLAGGGEGVDDSFNPDEVLRDGAVVRGDGWQVEALWTPGHMSNHMCFSSGPALFCGDHVMDWATSLVSPPDGDLTAFMQSCERLKGRPEPLFLSGHGDPIAAPADRLDWLMVHRKGREAQILGALAEIGPATPKTLAATVYTDIPPALLPAAERNVFAHLLDLCGRGLAQAEGPLSSGARYRAV